VTLADSEERVLVLLWNVGLGWSPELVIESTGVGVLVELEDDTLWDIDRGDLVSQVNWPQVLLELSGLLIVWEALSSSLEVEVLEDAGGLLGNGQLEGGGLIVHVGVDLTLVTWVVVGQPSIMGVVLEESHSDVLSDLDGGGFVVHPSEFLNQLISWVLWVDAFLHASSLESVVLEDGEAMLLLPGIVGSLVVLVHGEETIVMSGLHFEVHSWCVWNFIAFTPLEVSRKRWGSNALSTLPGSLVDSIGITVDREADSSFRGCHLLALSGPEILLISRDTSELGSGLLINLLAILVLEDFP